MVNTTAVSLRIVKTVLCDVRERDIVPLEVHNGSVSLVMTGAIATIRLIL
ncbi:MAG: hypothetical protein J7L76_04040 [Spirochaetaceae bacterium]|nr:hypothetical protein [Spirochaetaceae bacterium]